MQNFEGGVVGSTPGGVVGFFVYQLEMMISSYHMIFYDLTYGFLN